MSWDLFVQDLPHGITSLSEVPDDFQPKPLGKRADLIACIRDVVPNADFSSPSWGIIEGRDYSIEVSMGDSDEVRSFAFHVRGGDLAAVIVAEILKRLGLRALDPGASDGIFKLGSDSLASYQKWRSYRERIVAPEAAATDDSP